MNSKFIKIGHRGAMGYEPENTLRSFEKAVELGADMVEFDVHICKSGELVVIHDETVDGTTDGSGYVANMTLAELKTLDVGKGQTIPTLEEVLDTVNKRIGVNVELKGKGTARLVADTIQKYVKRGWNTDLFIVSSFDWGELGKFRRYAPKTRIGVLFNNSRDDFFDFAKTIGAYSIHAPLKRISESLVRQARYNGFKVFAWTADSPAEIKRLKKWALTGFSPTFPTVSENNL